MRLEGQVTSITGVSHAGQVGYALAAAFAREGALLSISARTASRVHARAEELRTQGARVIACTRAVWPVMKRQGGGKILNFSRAGGVQSSRPMMLAYNCAKAGIDALTYTFARVGKEFSIAVNALGPGLVTTQSNVESMKPTPEELRATWVSLEQIVEAALFLVSPAGEGVNGVVLPVQGEGI